MDGVQAIAAQHEEEVRQLQWRAQHNKQQLALYHQAQEAARAEEQAAALLQAEEAAAQVPQRTLCYLLGMPMHDFVDAIV